MGYILEIKLARQVYHFKNQKKKLLYEAMKEVFKTLIICNSLVFT